MKYLAICIFGYLAFTASDVERVDDDPVDEYVSEEIVYKIAAQSYVGGLSLDAAQSAGDEALALSALSLEAMLEGQFEAWLETWDSESGALIRRRTQESVGGSPKRTVAEWKAAWQRLSDVECLIVAKGVTPAFTVVAFELRKPKAKGPVGKRLHNFTEFDDGGVLRARVVVRQEKVGGEVRWRRTNAFNNHVVPMTWFSQTTSIRAVADSDDWMPIKTSTHNK